MKYFARKDNKGQVVEGSNVSSTRRSKTGRWFEFFYENCCDILDYTSDFIRYFVRKNNKGQIVDGSLISQKGKPKSGSWTEVFFPSCCFSENARYVDFYGIPWVEPYIPSLFAPVDLRGDGTGRTFTNIFDELSGTNFDSAIGDTALQYSEWYFSIVYSDSTGLSKSVVHRIPDYTAEDIKNYTKFWLDTVIKPLVPTFKAEIEGDKIKIDAFDREVWVSLGSPVQIYLSTDVLGSTDTVMEYTFRFTSIYGDYTFDFTPIGRSVYPPLTMIPYFSTWNVELINIVPNTIAQEFTLNILGNFIGSTLIPIGGADFSYTNFPSSTQTIDFTWLDD